MIQVKIRSYQVVKLILTGFVVIQENIKPSVLMHRPRKLGLYFKNLGLYIFLHNTKPVSIRIVKTIEPVLTCSLFRLQVRTAQTSFLVISRHWQMIPHSMLVCTPESTSSMKIHISAASSFFVAATGMAYV